LDVGVNSRIEKNTSRAEPISRIMLVGEHADADMCFIFDRMRSYSYSELHVIYVHEMKCFC